MPVSLKSHVLRNSGLSLTDRIKDGIRALVEANSFPPGGKLPSMRRLARELNVSHATVSKAVRELRIEGLLHCHQGKGVFINRRPSLGQQARIQWLSNMNDEEKTTLAARFRETLPQSELTITDTAPEIMAVPLELMPTLAGGLQDIAALVLENYGRQEQGGGAFDFLRVAGRMPVLPVTVASYAVMLNADFFEAAGAPLPSAQWTEGEFMDLARRLTRPEQGQYGFVACKDLGLFFSMVWQNGGRVFDTAGGRCLLSEPEAVAAARRLRELSHCSPPSGPVSRTHSMGFREFLSGRVAMTYAQSWDVAAARREAAFRWVVRPFPGGRIRAPFLHGNGYGVAQGSPLSEAVRTFLRLVADMEKWPSHLPNHGPIPLHRGLEEGDECARVFAEARDLGRTGLSDIEPSNRREAHLRALPVINSTMKQLICGDAPVESVLSHLRDIVGDMILPHAG